MGRPFGASERIGDYRRAKPEVQNRSGSAELARRKRLPSVPYQSECVDTGLGGPRSPPKGGMRSMRGKKNPPLDLSPVPEGTPLTFDVMARAYLEDYQLQRYRTMNTARRMPLFPKRLEENPPREGFFEHDEYLKVRAQAP